MSIITGKKVRIRKKQLSDAPEDYAWQKDTELSHLDAVRPLALGFSEYLVEYARELRQPSKSKHLFGVETLTGKHIGNCVYFEMDGDKSEVELGVMIGERTYWNQGYGSDTVCALVDYLFENTNIDRIKLKTLETNLRAQKSFKKCGFLPYGHLSRNGYGFLLMDIRRKKWELLREETKSSEES